MVVGGTKRRAGILPGVGASFFAEQQALEHLALRILELDERAGVGLVAVRVEQPKPSVLFFAGSDLAQCLEAYGAADQFLDVVELGGETVAIRHDPLFLLLGQGEGGVAVRDGDRGDFCGIEIGDHRFADAGFCRGTAASILNRGKIGDPPQNPQGENGDEKLFSFHGCQTAAVFLRLRIKKPMPNRITSSGIRPMLAILIWSLIQSISARSSLLVSKI